MKIKLITAILTMGASALLAQPSQNESQQQPPPPGGHRPPPPPVMVVLDTDHDGTISAEEIAGASEALKQLDKNQDGQLTKEELRPPRPPQDGGPDQ